VAVIYLRSGEYPAWMMQFQELFSIRPFNTHTFSVRVTGFAFEPSWLAHQLNILYLPLWLAATLSGYSAHKPRLFRVSLENFLLAGGLVLLFFSMSRIGLLAFLLVAAYLAVQLTSRLAKYLVRKIRPDPSMPTATRKRREIAMTLALFLAFAVIAAGVVYVAALLDPRLNRIFTLNRSRDTLFEVAAHLAFAERLVYWQAGLQIFARHPLLGVGLGNAGFFIQSNLPFQGQVLNEILSMSTFASFLPNIKCLWIRLLAETGIIGFSVFAAWLIIQWLATRFLRSLQSPLMRTIGWMGAITLIAYLAEGFSIDSLALPYIWVSLGLLTAASACARLKEQKAAEPPQSVETAG
jgi:O-antigen ligase